MCADVVVTIAILDFFGGQVVVPVTEVQLRDALPFTVAVHLAPALAVPALKIAASGVTIIAYGTLPIAGSTQGPIIFVESFWNRAIIVLIVPHSICVTPLLVLVKLNVIVVTVVEICVLAKPKHPEATVSITHAVILAVASVHPA
jgi:hypothetical protein